MCVCVHTPAFQKPDIVKGHRDKYIVDYNPKTCFYFFFKFVILKSWGFRRRDLLKEVQGVPNKGDGMLLLAEGVT